IEYLNADPDNRPAVIGIDTVYVGQSDDPDADAWLAEAAEAAGNVVVGAMATFDYGLVMRDGDLRFALRAADAWEPPYPALAAAADYGHVNAMLDGDEIFRHAMLYLDAPGEGTVRSMPRVIYERWCEYREKTPNPEPATKGGGFFYLPFSLRAGDHDVMSLAEVLEGTAPADAFSGKIVLIGPYTAGMQDDYFTSVDHAKKMYGVEVQANQIEAFDRGFFPTELSDTVQYVLLFVICVAAVLFFRNRKVWQALLVWAVLAGGWAGLCAALYRLGCILHVLWVPLAASVLFVASVVVNYLRASYEKRQVENTFGHYVDPAVMKQLLDRGADALELGGRLTDIAVLFVDIRGFTTMSESLDPPTVVEIINKYLTLTTECIVRNHGTLDKFVGDCTMAFWNAPVPQEDAVYLACRAAMDMVEDSRALGEELQRRFGRSVSFGVGVNWGPAVVGNIGAPRRMDYTAIGDTVNTASRLEANAPGGKIFISRAVADILGERAEVTSLGGSIRLKGKAEGFEILTLDALRERRDSA
ncbi:MAG: CHASE2 domain-containing protein, partial [Oscillospiraceae bacterium]|nr:CHASE2 domain-containing protein [Oscillospiraceae bacterium]